MSVSQYITSFIENWYPLSISPIKYLLVKAVMIGIIKKEFIFDYLIFYWFSKKIF